MFIFLSRWSLWSLLIYAILLKQESSQICGGGVTAEVSHFLIRSQTRSWSAGVLTTPTHQPIIVNGRTNLGQSHATNAVVMTSGCRALGVLDSCGFLFSLCSLLHALMSSGKRLCIIGASCRAWLAHMHSHSQTHTHTHTHTLTNMHAYTDFLAKLP